MPMTTERRLSLTDRHPTTLPPAGCMDSVGQSLMTWTVRRCYRVPTGGVGVLVLLLDVLTPGVSNVRISVWHLSIYQSSPVKLDSQQYPILTRRPKLARSDFLPPRATHLASEGAFHVFGQRARENLASKRSVWQRH